MSMWLDQCLGTVVKKDISILNDFIFTNDKKEAILMQKETERMIVPVIRVTTSITQLDTVRQCEDPLFWSIYLAVNTMAEYQRAWNTTNVEMEEKTKIAEKFHKCQNEMKAHMHAKITKVMCGRISEQLLVKPKVSVVELPALCYYYNVDLYLVNTENHTYICYTKNNPEKEIVLYKKGNKYFIDTAESYQSIENIKQEYVHVMDSKPFKAMSNYKMGDLEEIANKTGFIATESLLKKKLYDNLMVHCMWK